MVLVPVGGEGRLWALMVDMGRSWDALVRRHAPDDDTRERLLDNRLYRTLTQRFVQSHDYIALDHLVDLVDEDRFDLVVIDTPPSSHVLDVLDAPDRMVEFFGSRLLTWLTAPYRSRMVMASAKPFLAVAERLLGGQFLAEVTEFFWLFSSLQPDFVERAALVRQRLDDPSTHYVVVQTAEPKEAEQAESLVDALLRRGHRLSLRVVNRVLPASVATLGAADIGVLSSTSSQSAVADLVRAASAERELLSTIDGHQPVQTVAWSAESLQGVDDLVRLLDD